MWLLVEISGDQSGCWWRSWVCSWCGMGCKSLDLFGFGMGFKSCDCERWICSSIGINLVFLLMGFDGGGGGDGLWVWAFEVVVGCENGGWLFLMWWFLWGWWLTGLWERDVIRWREPKNNCYRGWYSSFKLISGNWINFREVWHCGQLLSFFLVPCRVGRKMQERRWERQRKKKRKRKGNWKSYQLSHDSTWK